MTTTKIMMIGAEKSGAPWAVEVRCCFYRMKVFQEVRVEVENGADVELKREGAVGESLGLVFSLLLQLQRPRRVTDSDNVKLQRCVACFPCLKKNFEGRPLLNWAEGEVWRSEFGLH
jgi:hypothetical protein